MDTIFEISNLVFVWFLLIFFLKNPFFASIKNYIAGEKNRRTSSEEFFLTAKKRDDQIADRKKQSQDLVEFLNSKTPKNGFDIFPQFSSPLQIEVTQKITLESYLQAILSK